MSKKIVVFAKQKAGFPAAMDFLRSCASELSVFTGEVGDPFPDQAKGLEADLIISHLSPWVISRQVLSNAKEYAINFHPGSPDYPGTGCTNFALYNNEKRFGVTAHLMEEKVDAGKILGVEWFPIYEEDTVSTLLER